MPDPFPHPDPGAPNYNSGYANVRCVPCDVKWYHEMRNKKQPRCWVCGKFAKHPKSDVTYYPMHPYFAGIFGGYIPEFVGP